MLPSPEYLSVVQLDYHPYFIVQLHNREYRMAKCSIYWLIFLIYNFHLFNVLSHHYLALFDMPNLNRFDILSISIFCKIALSISISIFSKITISISISIFLELPYRYRYRYRYFSELPYRYRYRYFQLLHIDIDIDIDIFQKCRYIDNRYFLSIF